MAKIKGYKVIGTTSKGKEAIGRATGVDELIVCDEAPGSSFEDYIRCRATSTPPPSSPPHSARQPSPPPHSATMACPIALPKYPPRNPYVTASACNADKLRRACSVGLV